MPYKRFSAVELKLGTDKGLCYYCDGKYFPNDKCKTACYLLVGQEEMEEMLDKIHTDNANTEEEGDNPYVMELTLEISINALASQFHLSALRVIGKCDKKVVRILIDNGSNNNFIEPSVARRLNLIQTPTTAFKVGTGSGAFLQCSSNVRKWR